MAAKRGRPTRLTPEITKAFCDQLVSGCTVQTAAECLELDTSTVHIWMTKGRIGKKPFVDFFKAVTKARASTVQRLLARAQHRVKSKKDGGEGADPLPLLAIVDPRQYAPRVRVHVVAELNAALDALEHEFANEPEILARALDAISGVTGSTAGVDAGAESSARDAGPDVVVAESGGVDPDAALTAAIGVPQSRL